MPYTLHAGNAESRTTIETQRQVRPAASPSSLDILAVLPALEDHAALDRILTRPAWCIHKARSLPSALRKLKSKRLPVVLCERDLDGYTWKDLLCQIRDLTHPPLLVVTSRIADEHLWAEVLNLGAYDVLSKPFEAFELQRSLSSAWRRWHSCTRRPGSVLPAASSDTALSL